MPSPSQVSCHRPVLLWSGGVEVEGFLGARTLSVGLGKGRRGPLRASWTMRTGRPLVVRDMPTKGQLHYCEAAGDYRRGDSDQARPLWGGWVGGKSRSTLTML